MRAARIVERRSEVKHFIFLCYKKLQDANAVGRIHAAGMMGRVLGSGDGSSPKVLAAFTSPWRLAATLRGYRQQRPHCVATVN